LLKQKSYFMNIFIIYFHFKINYYYINCNKIHYKHKKYLLITPLEQ